MFDKQGQKTVAAKIQQPQQESVVIKPDQTITIDGKQADCFKKACELKQGEATVAKVQTSDGKTQIQLSTKVRIPPACCFYRLNVLLTLFKVLSSEILTCTTLFFSVWPARYNPRSADPGVRLASTAQPCSRTVW